jgi:hypothetical protein
MNNFRHLNKIITSCGRQFDKGMLTVAAFTIPDFTQNSSSYVIYQSMHDEYIRCINSFDAAKDYITVECTLIGEEEASLYLVS